MKIQSGSRGLKGIAVLLTVLLLAAMMVTEVPTAYAEESAPVSSDEPSVPESEPTLTPEPTETPQPSEEPLPTETPQPTETSFDTQEIIEINGAECLGGQIIIKLEDDVSDAESQCILNSLDSTIQAELPADNLVVAEVPEGESAEDFIEVMEEQPDVEYAQPNYVYRLPDAAVTGYMPNSMFGLAPNDPYAYEQWYLDMIGVFDAWNITTGSPSVRVAVIDTGIDFDHPDLAGKVVAQADIVAGNGNADDEDGHGTNVAGIIAANTNNSIGVAGIAPNVRLIAVDVFDGSFAYTSEIIKGIQFASSNGADVINLSLGFYYRDTALEQEINTAVSKGIPVVCAAGNDNTTVAHYPSDFDAAISVIATDWYDGRASYSNYGLGKDISAPGGDGESLPYSGASLILSTDKNAGYVYMAGTSQAAPVVSGVIALILSVNPNLSVEEVKSILYSSAEDKGIPGRDDVYGYGRVDAFAAVFATTAPAVAAASEDSTSLNISWNTVAGTSGYEIWRAASAAGPYAKLTTTTNTAYIDTGLATSTAYYYKVRAYSITPTTTVYGNFSSYASAVTCLSVPRATAVTSASYNSLYVSWNAVSGASGYELSRATSLTGSYKVVKTTSSLSYTNTKLGTGTTYYYRVRAYRTVGRTKTWGDYSTVTSATPMLTSVASATASAYYPTSVKVSWSAVSGRTKYEVWRATEEYGTYTRVGTTSSTYYKDTTCTPFVTYYYQIRVYRTVNRQPIYSASASPTASATPILGNVAGVQAAVSSPSSIKLSWTSVTGVSGYEIWRSTSADSGYTLVKSTSGRSYTDSSCIPNTSYYYQVRAYRKVGTGIVPSSFCAPVSATPYFGSVTNARAVSSSAAKIKLTWSAVSGRTGYEVYRSASSDGDFVLIKSTTSTSITDSCLTPGVTYYYKIVAYRMVNNVRYRSTETIISVTL